MAIVVDQTTIGSVCTDATSTTQTFNTTATVASGGFIVVVAGCNNATTCTISGGGLTWTQNAPASGSSQVFIASAQAPSGLASGTTLTATYGVSVFGRFMGGISFTGVKTSAPLDVAGTQQTATGSTAWTTGNLTIAAGSVLIGVAEGFTTNGTSTPTSPSIESCDVNGGAGTENATLAYRIEASGGAFSVAGTWSTAQDWFGIGAAYLAAPTVGGGGPPSSFTGIPRVTMCMAPGAPVLGFGTAGFPPVADLAPHEAIYLQAVNRSATT